MTVNKVILLGRLGADPELRYTPSQLAICNLSIATSERRQSPQGEWEEQTEWHRVVVFNKQAENCNQYLQKGREVFIEGRLRTNKWQDKDGNNRYTTEIIASNVKFIGSRSDTSNFSSRPPEEEQFRKPEKVESPKLDDSVSFEDDDIPF